MLKREDLRKDAHLALEKALMTLPRLDPKSYSEEAMPEVVPWLGNIP